jgi:hypothetical protein
MSGLINLKQIKNGSSIEKLLQTAEKGNYTISYQYSQDGTQIVSETYTGDINKVVQYTYFDATSEFFGSVKTEVTTTGSEVVTKTYGYETGTGSILSVTVTTV